MPKGLRRKQYIANGETPKANADVKKRSNFTRKKRKNKGAETNAKNMKLVQSSGEDSDVEDEAPQKVQFPTRLYFADVKNKIKKHELYQQYKQNKMEAKSKLKQMKIKEAEMTGTIIKKQKPRSIEAMRAKNMEFVANDDEDLVAEEGGDHYANYYAKKYRPKILITATDKVHRRTIKFMRELALVVPNSVFRFRRKEVALKLLPKIAQRRGFTDILVINEDQNEPNGILVMHMPKGPTAYFRLRNVKTCKDIKRKASDITGHRPELVLSNFRTRLGRVVGRLFGALFDADPEFSGRSVCTFHNQRDFIFFRHHRYQFRNEKKVGLQELGPRFTLRLAWLKDGILDGDYEWVDKKQGTKFLQLGEKKYHL